MCDFVAPLVPPTDRFFDLVFAAEPTEGPAPTVFRARTAALAQVLCKGSRWAVL